MVIHTEFHRSGRSGWLRAAVLGADDGLVSTAALLMGLVGAGVSKSALLTAGVAALSAGALAMAIGEYVSVSAQSDAEKADIRKETLELTNDPARELEELTAIYVERGLSEELALEVANALHERDVLGAHIRDELGHDERTRARPLQAAGVSAVSFALGATLPLLTIVVTSPSLRTTSLVAITIVLMCLLGAVGANLGGAPATRGALRVGIGGALALAITYGVGLALGSPV
ncbi:MAG: VIT family protein [Acidobacteriota bacterium]|nr:VIT family protein [Acidobacteriota bacterium]